MYDRELRTHTDAQILRVALDQARDLPIVVQDHPVPDKELRSRLIHRHRIGPLIHRAWPEPDTQEWQNRQAMGQLQLVATGHEVATVLQDSGIETRVLKGLATAELDYVNPTLRHTGDVDLLVNPSDFTQASELILASGTRPHLNTAVDPELMKGSTYIHPNGTEIDLHFRLSRYFPPAPRKLMFADPCPLSGGVFAMPAELRLIHAAAHALLTPVTVRRLSSLADITALIDNTGVDWDRARHAADQLGLAEIVGAALQTEAKILARDSHPGLHWPAPPWLLNRTFIKGGRHLLSEHLLAVLALPPGSSRVQYAKGWFVPSQDSLDYRGGRAAYFKRLYRQFRA